MSVQFPRNWSDVQELGTQMIERCLKREWDLRRATTTIGRENRSKEMIGIAGDEEYRRKASTVSKVLELAKKQNVLTLVDKRRWEMELLGIFPGYGYEKALSADLRKKQVDLILKNLDVPGYKQAYALEPIDLEYVIAGNKELQLFTTLRSFREDSYLDPHGQVRRSRGVVVVYFQDEGIIKDFIEEFDGTFNDPTKAVGDKEKVQEWLKNISNLL